LWSEVARRGTPGARIHGARVVAVGSPPDVLGRVDLIASQPATETGVLIDAVVAAHDEDFGLTTLKSAAGALQAPRLDLAVGTPVRARIRARDVMIATVRPDGLSALNVVPGRVAALAQDAEGLVEVALDCGGVRLIARLTRRSVQSLRLESGRDVYAVLKSVALDRDTLGRAPAEPMSADATARRA